MVRTVIQMNNEITLSNRAISIARIGRKRQASTKPQATPIGVMTSNKGFAMRIVNIQPIPDSVSITPQNHFFNELKTGRRFARSITRDTVNTAIMIAAITMITSSTMAPMAFTQRI